VRSTVDVITLTPQRRARLRKFKTLHSATLREPSAEQLRLTTRSISAPFRRFKFAETGNFPRLGESGKISSGYDTRELRVWASTDFAALTVAPESCLTSAQKPAVSPNAGHVSRSSTATSSTSAHTSEIRDHREPRVDATPRGNVKLRSGVS
jgi:hypothetical protein